MNVENELIVVGKWKLDDATKFVINHLIPVCGFSRFPIVTKHPFLTTEKMNLPILNDIQPLHERNKDERKEN